MKRSEIDRFAIGRGCLFQQPQVFRSALLKRAVAVKFKAGEPVFHVDDDLGGIYGIAIGSFLACLPGHGASLRLAHIVRSGVWFGHGPALTRDSRKISISAAEPSVALHVPLASLQELIAADSAAARCLAALGEFGARIAYGAVADLLLRRSGQRIAATLLRVTETRADEAEPAGGYVLTQGQLAEMANVSRDVANRTLTDFEARGWIALGYNRIAIVERAALAAEAARER